MNTIKRNELDFIYTKRLKEEKGLYTNKYSRFIIFPIKLKIINLYNLDPNLRWSLVKNMERVLLKKEKISELIFEINKSLPEINNCGWTWRYLGIILVSEKDRKSNQFKRYNLESLLKYDLQYIYLLNKGTTKMKNLIIYKNLLNINPKKSLPKVINNLLNLSYLPDNSRAVISYMKEDLLKLLISQLYGWV